VRVGYFPEITDASRKLEGFGGWLLLVAIGQWLGVFERKVSRKGSE
jgi:hypothetical protein